MLNRWRALTGKEENCRVISLQLGAGCSLTATDNGRPIDTSMGFSPLEGLVMASRCGDLDPTVVLYLIKHGGYSAAELERILNEFSGLSGVSGQTSDMQTLLASSTEDAMLAVDLFCHRVRKYMGAFLAVLGGADAILFGGGIGENVPDIRARVLEQFYWAGIQLDTERNCSINPANGGPIHADKSAIEVWVIPTDEERVMADTASILLAQSTQSDMSSTMENNC